jgi:hypothetical protein
MTAGRLTRAARSAKFDQLFAAGRQALLSGTHLVESAPVDGRPRWGIGAALRPDRRAAQAVEQVAVAAAAVVGEHHWLAGGVSSSHLTLRAGLERYRASVPAGDARVARYAAALRTAAASVGPVRFAVTGLTLTPISVMACAFPADTAADDLAAAFEMALRPECPRGDGRRGDGRDQAGSPPEIWYLNLVYFTGPVRDAEELVGWVAARRATEIADALITDMQITRWQHTAAGMRPVVLASVAAAAPRSADVDEGPRQAGPG